MDERTQQDAGAAPRQVPGPGTEISVRMTGAGLRALLNAAQAQGSAAAAMATELENRAARESDPKVRRALEGAARVHRETHRIATGLWAEICAAHRGEDPLVGTCIDDVRRAEHGEDLQRLARREGRV